MARQQCAHHSNQGSEQADNQQRPRAWLWLAHFRVCTPVGLKLCCLPLLLLRSKWSYTREGTPSDAGRLHRQQTHGAVQVLLKQGMTAS